MMFALMTLATVFGTATADLPPDITAKEREKLVKRWQDAYAADRTKWTKAAGDGRTMMKFADTAVEGRRKLTEAEAALKALDTEPWQLSSTPFKLISRKQSTGTVVYPSSAARFVAGGRTGDGVIVEGVITLTKLGYGPEKYAVKFLVASPLDVPKGKKNPPMSMTGLWYVAGEADVGGEKVPVLYEFKLTKEEIEKAKNEK